MYIHSPDAVAVAFAYEPCIVVLCTVYIIVLYIRVYSYGACRFCECMKAMTRRPYSARVKRYVRTYVRTGSHRTYLRTYVPT